MKKLLSVCFLLLGFSVFSQDLPPKPSVLVTDNAGILSGEEKQALEQKLVAFNDSTSTQISILIMHSTGVYDINEYAQKVGQAWGIGQEKKNNGALILVAYDDHKISIQTGYGLEGAIPDALAKQIIERDIKPYFKQGQYYQGLNQGTSTMISLAKGEYTADQYANKKQKAGKPGFLIYIIIFIIFLVFVFRTRSVRSYASTNNIPFWVAWGLMNSAGRRRGGFWDDFSSGSGGFGGGSGGGGFGGFGGGSFGGGGASGSW